MRIWIDHDTPSQIPHVNRQEFTLLDVGEDGFVSPSPPPPFPSRRAVIPFVHCLGSLLDCMGEE